MSAAMSAVILGNLEANVAGAADAHQCQQGTAEFRHRQVAVDADDEYTAKDDGPAEDLQAMNGGAVDVRGHVFEETLSFERQDVGFVCGQSVSAVVDVQRELRDASIRGHPLLLQLRGRWRMRPSRRPRQRLEFLLLRV